MQLRIKGASAWRSRMTLSAAEARVRQGDCGTAPANLAASVLISPGRNNQPALRRNGRSSGSSGGSAARAARAQVVPAELFDEFGVDADDPVAALDAGLARGNPRRRLPDGSKGCLGVMVAVHDRPPRHTGQEDRSLRSAGAASRFPPERTPGHGRAPSGRRVRPVRVRRVRAETAPEEYMLYRCKPSLSVGVRRAADTKKRDQAELCNVGRTHEPPFVGPEQLGGR